MSLKDHYDWVVLGDHPGAYLSGVMVARLGLSVLFLRLAPGMKSQVSEDGQFFDPESNHLVGLGKSGPYLGLVRECLNRSGMTAPESDAIRNGESAPQVITPDLRLKLLEEDGAFSWEIRRELGPDSQGLSEALFAGQKDLINYWAKLPKRLTVEPGKKRRFTIPSRLSSVYRQLGRGPDMREHNRRQWVSSLRLSEFESRVGSSYGQMIRGLWEGVTATTAQDPSLSEVLHFLALGRTSTAYRGGLTAYREYLLKLAMRLGADSAEENVCKRILVEKGRFAGVQINTNGAMITADGGVIGCSIGDLSELVTLRGQSFFRQLKKKPVASGWKFTIALTVGADAIPAGTGRRLVWQERGAPIIEIEIVTPDEQEDILPDSRVILARTVLPLTQESLSTAFQRMTGARMFRQLCEIFPFLEFHVEKVFPDFRADPQAPFKGESSEELGRIYGFPLPELIPENLRVYAGKGTGAKSGIDGLFVASGEAFPELGSHGAAVAAVEATAWIAHQCGLSGPLP